MIKNQQVEDLREYGFDYITAIAKPRITLRSGCNPDDLFDQPLAEIIADRGKSAFLS